MDKYSLSHLSEGSLEQGLVARANIDRINTPEFLAHIAEYDARKSYLPKAYPSMLAYCVQALELCEQAALKRIRVARVARSFPQVFAALAERRLHISSVLLLSPYLTAENGAELLASAERRSRLEIERMLAGRFPRPELGTEVRPLCGAESNVATLSPGTVGNDGQTSEGAGELLTLSPGTVSRHETAAPAFPRLTPLAADRYALQVTIGTGTHDKLRRAQELLGHQVAPGDLAQVLDRALEALIGQIEKRKFGATKKPRNGGGATGTGRHIPAHVRRAVRERDGDRCAYVSETGRRCTSRTHLEFDHMDAVALGGRGNVDRVRLLCRAHNQFEAERTFGTEFMRRKKEAEIAARAQAKLRKAGEQAVAVATNTASETGTASVREGSVLPGSGPADSATTSPSAAPAPGTVGNGNDLIPWLRALGYRARDAQQGAAACAHIPDASLEQRLKVALASFPPRGVRTGSPRFEPSAAPASRPA